MWQSQVENVHYSYHFLTTFFQIHNVITLSVSVPESYNLILSNSYLSAKSVPNLGMKLQSI